MLQFGPNALRFNPTSKQLAVLSVLPVPMPIYPSPSG